MRERAIVAMVAVGLGCGSHDAAVVERTAVPAKAADPTQAEFAALLIAELSKRGGSAKLKFDAAQSSITDGDLVLATGNLYGEYIKLDPADRPAELVRITSALASYRDPKDPALAEVRGKLLPTVRAGLYFDIDLQSTSHKPPSHGPLSVPIGDHAGAAVAIDQPEAMEIVSDKLLSTWGLGIDQALAIATDNLASKGTPFEQIQPGVWASAQHDSYESSRLLLVDQIRKLGLAGTPVAVIPNRNTIYLAGSADAKALLAIAELADKAADEPRPIHTIPLCLGGRTWSECEPAPTPAVQTRLHALATLGKLSLYHEQQELLAKKLGDGVYVAAYTAVEDKDSKRMYSYATWSRTVPTLLPKAELIAFVEVSREHPDAKPVILGMVPWDRVMKIVGSHLVPDGRNPQRWATGDYFPTKAELAALAPSKNVRATADP